jgi:hypothetical protein
MRVMWATPRGDELIAYMARVSNPDNQDNTKRAQRHCRSMQGITSNTVSIFV